jgi:hypothetical protein
MPKKINLKFEKFDCPVPKFLVNRQYKFIANREQVGNFMMSDQMGFRFSQVIDGMIHYYEKNPNSKIEILPKIKLSETLEFKSIDVDDGEPYIIPVAVQYAPQDWADCDFNGDQVPNKKSIFELINPKYLQDLQNGNAILLIDQSVEGYSNNWLWEWFHRKCKLYKINPAAIIYATGDQSCADTYEDWCELHRPKNKLKVLPSISLSTFVRIHYDRFNLNFNFEELYNYKKENANKIYLYDCTNKRPRPQRVYNFLHLLNAGLLDKGNISMPAYDTWAEWFVIEEDELKKYKLPLDIEEKLMQPGVTPREANHNYSGKITHYFSYVERILDDMYKNSWVSLVVESSFFEREHSNFISEKSFKPIAAMQPFITVGSRGTLKYLHRLGYKTFHPFIDESYDDKPDEERFLAIIETLKKIEAIEDKASWFNSMRDILEHNHRMFTNIGNVKSIEHNEVFNYYFHYFKDKNV